MLIGHGGTCNNQYLEMEQKFRQGGYALVRQPPNSPCFNMCDLGFWNALKTAVKGNAYKIHDKLKTSNSQYNVNLIQKELWELCKKTVREMDPKVLFNIAVQKQVLMGKCIIAEGGSVQESHYEIRKFWELVNINFYKLLVFAIFENAVKKILQLQEPDLFCVWL